MNEAMKAKLREMGKLPAIELEVDLPTKQAQLYVYYSRCRDWIKRRKATKQQKKSRARNRT